MAPAGLYLPVRRLCLVGLTPATARESSLAAPLHLGSDRVQRDARIVSALLMRSIAALLLAVAESISLVAESISIKNFQQDPRVGRCVLSSAPNARGHAPHASLLLLTFSVAATYLQSHLFDRWQCRLNRSKGTTAADAPHAMAVCLDRSSQPYCRGARSSQFGDVHPFRPVWA